MTFNNPIKACFSNKKYPVKYKSNPYDKNFLYKHSANAIKSCVKALKRP